MRFRKLRIAWSVGCGIACVLLTVLWVRSYAYIDILDAPITASRNIYFTSERAGFWIAVSDNPTDAAVRWKIKSQPVDPEVSAGVNELTTNHGFAFLYSSPFYAFASPYWLPIAISLALAPLAWIRRFSLRTLLIATTLVAVALGFVVWKSH